jgi:FkbM family methyltransferase
MGSFATRLRRLGSDYLFKHGGLPIAPRLAWRVHHLGVIALGSSTAMLGVDRSGEQQLMEDLAPRWAQLERIEVFDVGANVGDYAVAASASFGERARIHSFEPDPETFAELSQRLASTPGATCHQLALSAEAGDARLFRDPQVSAVASLHPETFDHRSGEDDSVLVHTDSLDRVAEELGVRSIQLLKIDVEGHELSVLKGARRLLSNGAIDVVQFEFGERSLAARSYLHDFFELLGPAFTYHRLTRKGPLRFEYSPSWEIFVGEANYVAIRER